MDQTENRHILRITGAQAAVFLGCTYQSLQQMLMSDDPPPREDDKTYRTDKLGEYTRRRAVKLSMGHRKNARIDLPGTDTGDGADVMGGLLNPIQERARKDKELADKTALENQLRRGELVDAREVSARWIEILTRVKSRLLRIPWAAAPLLLGEDDQVKIQIVIEDQIRDALTELSGGE